jgi:hypothetical protein
MFSLYSAISYGTSAVGCRKPQLHGPKLDVHPSKWNMIIPICLNGNAPQLFMTSYSTSSYAWGRVIICCQVLANFLYQNGFTNVNERDSSGWSPLLYAALGGNPATWRAALCTKSTVIWDGLKMGCSNDFLTIYHHFANEHCNFGVYKHPIFRHTHL